MTKGFNHDILETIMIKFITISKLFLVLALLPASASAALIVSDWTATPTTLSFKITGTIEEGVTIGPHQKHRMFIGPSNLAPENKWGVSGTVTSLGGSPTSLNFASFFNNSSAAKIQLEKAGGDWAVGDMLNYSISFSSSILYDVTAWNPTGGIVSAGRSSYTAAPEEAYQVGSFAAVPDTGSTAALFGVGVAALAFARRRLG